MCTNKSCTPSANNMSMSGDLDPEEQNIMSCVMWYHLNSHVMVLKVHIYEVV